MTLTGYRGRKVLVTGHTGFKGSWLALWLQRLGADVVGFSLDPPSDPNLFEAIDLGAEVRGRRIDIRDFGPLSRGFEEEQPEVVFHLAAQPIVRLSYREPRETFQTNVMGTVNVLEAARLTGSVRALVNVTSDKCYENREWLWGYRETDHLGGSDPYSASKACSELVTASYLKSYFARASGEDTTGMAVASARAGNVIGGGDWGADRLIPDCVRAFASGRPLHLRYPRAVRPWQHVLDPLCGYLLLGAKLLGGAADFGGAWNFGPAEAELWPVERVVSRVFELLGSGEYTVDAGPKPHEAGLLKLDCSKARALLGWRPRLSTAEALAQTATWYERYCVQKLAAPLLRDFTASQIESYQNALPALP